MFHATELISQFFDEKEIRYRIQDLDEVSVVTANVAVDYTTFIIQFLSRDNENDVSIRVPNFVRYGNKNSATVLRVAAECNALFRYVKFTVNTEEHSVSVEYDMPQETADDALGECVHEMFRRIMQICDEAYPKFMEALWGRDADTPEYGKIVFHDFEV